LDIAAGTLTATTSSGGIFLNANTVANLGAVTARGGDISFDNGDTNLALTGTIKTRKDSVGGAITIDVGTGALDTADQSVVSRNDNDDGNSDGVITLIADSIDLGTTADRITTTGAVVLKPTTTTRSIEVSTGDLENADSADTEFNLSTNEVEVVNATTSGLTIGDATYTGQITVNVDDYDFGALTIAGGNIDVVSALTTSNNTALTLDGVGIDQSGTGTIDMGSGAILFDAGAAAVTSVANTLTITTTNGLTISNATTVGATSQTDNAALETAVAQLTITASSDTFISEANAVELQGINVGTNTFGINNEGGGAITQTATGITATSVQVTNTVGATTLTAVANSFANLGTSDFSGQTAQITVAGALDIDGVAGAASLTLASAGAGDITNAGGGITAATLSVSNDTVSRAVLLNSNANTVANLSAVTARGGAISFDNGNTNLALTGTIRTHKDTVGGAITIDVGTGALDTRDESIVSHNDAGGANSDGVITLIADSIDLGTTADKITTTGTVVLKPTTTTRVIKVSTGDPENDDIGDTEFNLSTNEVTAVNATSTGFTIGDATYTGQITLTADSYDVAALTIAGGNIDVVGALTTSNNTALTLDGVGLDQSGTGTINMGSGAIVFEAGGAAVTSVADALTITTAGGLTINNATTVGATSQTDNAALETAVAELTITAGVGDTFISEADAAELQGINVGANTFGINLEGAGALTQTATGITATNVEVTNTVGATTLTAAANSFANLGTSNFTGQIAQITAGGALDLDGVTGANTLTLIAGGALTQAGTITSTNLGITNTAGTTTLNAANAVTNLNTSNFTGQTAALTVAGALDIDGVTGANTLTLNVGGLLTQAGAITSTNLGITNTAASTTLNAANVVTNLNTSNFTGQTAALTVTGALDIDGVTGADTLTLNAGGSLTQGGVITSTNLGITNTAGSTTLNAANVVTNLNTSNFTGQTAALTVTGALDIDGVTGANSLTLTSSGPGDITNAGGGITATTLSVSNDSVSGAVLLNSNANAVTNLAAVTARGGAISFDNGDTNLALAGTIKTRKDSVGGAITIDVGTGALDTADQSVVSRNDADGDNSDGVITLIADSIDLGTTADKITTTGAVVLRPTTTSRVIKVSTGDLENFDNTDTEFNLSTNEIEAVNATSSGLTIGDATYTGQITLNADAYDFAALTIAGGNIDVVSALTTSNNTALTLDGVGIDQSGTGTINMGSGAILFEAGAAAVTSVADALTITTTNTAAGGLTINNATTIGATSQADNAALETSVAELTITAGAGATFISEADAVELQGINVGANTLGINLEGAGALTQTATGITATGVTTLTAAGSVAPFNDITLNSVNNDFGTVVITQGGDVTLSDSNSITLGSATVGGDYNVTTDSDNTGISTMTISGVINASGDVLFSGTSANDIIDVDSNISAGGSLTLQQASDIQLKSGAALTAQAGDLDLDNSVTKITLDTAGTVNLTQSGDANSVQLVPVTTGAVTTNLVISAQGSVTAQTIDLDGGGSADGTLSITIDSNTTTPETLTIDGAITNVADITLTGGADSDNTIDINQDITGTGSISIENAGTVDLASGVDLTGTSIAASTYIGTINLSGVANNEITTTTGSITFSDVTSNAAKLILKSVGGTTTVGSYTGLGGGKIQVLDSNGTVFGGTLGDGAVNADTVELTNTTGSIKFEGNTTIATLSTNSVGYALEFTGASNQVGNNVTFDNTGGLTLGRGGAGKSDTWISG
jgi:hypothetical protein